MRILVDTNVFIDLILKREPYYQDDVNFINNCKEQRHEMYISAMSFRDIEYVIRKSIHNVDEVKRILNKVYGLVTKIVPIEADDAINTLFEYEKDFEDYLLSCSAESAMLDCIVTNNKKDFVQPRIKAFSVQEFNQYIKK